MHGRSPSSQPLSPAFRTSVSASRTGGVRTSVVNCRVEHLQHLSALSDVRLTTIWRRRLLAHARVSCGNCNLRGIRRAPGDCLSLAPQTVGRHHSLPPSCLFHTHKHTDQQTAPTSTDVPSTALSKVIHILLTPSPTLPRQLDAHGRPPVQAATARRGPPSTDHGTSITVWLAREPWVWLEAPKPARGYVRTHPV